MKKLFHHEHEEEKLQIRSPFHHTDSTAMISTTNKVVIGVNNISEIHTFEETDTPFLTIQKIISSIGFQKDWMR